MSRFDVSKEDERLTLTLSMSERLLAAGCPLFFFALVCVTALGVLGLMLDSHASPMRGDGAFFHPRGNHLGFLWLIGLLLMLFLVPFYVVKASRSDLVFSFHRDTGLFLRNGAVVTPIRRIESVRIRPLCDPDDAYSYRLVIVYADGHEIVLHNSYDERGIRELATQIGSFIGVPVI
jgi:hypothetical protein